MIQNTVTHKITEEYKVIEYRVSKQDGINDVYFKVSFMDDNEFQERFNSLQEAIEYINNLTFK